MLEVSHAPSTLFLAIFAGVIVLAMLCPLVVTIVLFTTGNTKSRPARMPAKAKTLAATTSKFPRRTPAANRISQETA